MAGKKTKDADIRDDIVKAIEEIFPDNSIDISIDDDGSYFWDVYPKLKVALSQIEEAVLLYERKPQGEEWVKEPDSDENTSDIDELSYSYCMFFMGHVDERFTFETEGEVADEEGVIQSFEGTGRIGCAFGVSLLAPFASITLDNIEYYKDGTQGLPDIEPHIFNMNGEVIDMDEHFREMLEDNELKILHVLRGKIKSVLESLGITVLPEEELLKPVPWLQAGNRSLTVNEITVRNAFFYRL